MISAFDFTIKMMYERMFIEPETHPELLKKKREKKDRLMVSLVGLEELTRLMSLGPRYMNRLIGFRGIVIRCSDIYPEMRMAAFRCAECTAEVTVLLENAKVEEPKECTKCRHKNTMEIQHNLSIFSNKQYIKFQ